MDWRYLAGQFDRLRRLNDGFTGEHGSVECRRFGKCPEQWFVHNFTSGQVRFTELAETAGRQLFSEKSKLPLEIEQEPDDFSRWCCYLRETFSSRVRQEPPIGVRPDQPNSSAYWLIRESIPNVVEASISACERLSVAEPMAEDGDLIEECLRGQQLDIYRFLKGRRRRTKFSTLQDQPEFWRKDCPGVDTVVRALRRLQNKLNEITGAPTLTIYNAEGTTQLQN